NKAALPWPAQSLNFDCDYEQRDSHQSRCLARSAYSTAGNSCTTPPISKSRIGNGQRLHVRTLEACANTCLRSTSTSSTRTLRRRSRNSLTTALQNVGIFLYASVGRQNARFSYARKHHFGKYQSASLGRTVPLARKSSCLATANSWSCLVYILTH